MGWPRTRPCLMVLLGVALCETLILATVASAEGRRSPWNGENPARSHRGGEERGAASGRPSAMVLAEAPSSLQEAVAAARARDVNNAADPTVAAQEIQLTASGGAPGDLLGDAVAVSGDTAVVGAQGDDTVGGINAGSATVFERSGGTWTEGQTLEASNGATYDAFGWSVAISGETVVVGAPIADSGAGPESGVAYIFVRSGGTWTEQQEVFASDATQDAQFGHDVAVSGDTVVVGARAANVPSIGNAGAAYVFTRSGTTWTEQQKLTASDASIGVDFGYSVDVSGDIIMVGAYLADGPTIAGSGAAYAFVWSDGTWTEEAKLGASNGVSGDWFGTAVAVDGDTAVVGARRREVSGQFAAGSAYAFLRSGGSWTEQSELLPPFAVAGDLFGYSVDVDGDTAVVGDPFDGTTGSAYLFARRGTSWTRDQKLIVSGASGTAEAGRSVALGVGLAVVGAWMDDPPAGAEAGAAYVFRVSEQLLASDASADDDLGVSVAIDGNTAVVGAYLADPPAGSAAGAAYVFVRSHTTWTEEAKLTAANGAAGDQFGTSVAVDGDTAVVGAPFRDMPAGNDAGAAYVFVRSGTTWAQETRLKASDGAAGDQFGTSVAVHGDTAVVGAPFHDLAAGGDTGDAYVFVRSGTTWSEEQTLKASDRAAADQFGTSVAVDGDTAVVGAPFHDLNAGADVGAGYVFVRSGAAWTQEKRLKASDGAVTDQFGTSVAVHGDTAVVGAPFHDLNAGADVGAGYVFVRSGTAWTQESRLKASDGAATDQFGTSVAVHGDAAAIGSPFHDPPGAPTNAGAVYRFERAGAIWTEDEKFVAAAPLVEDELGRSAAVSGPLVVAGAPLHLLIGLPHAGAAYVFESIGIRPDISSFSPASAKVGKDVTISGSAFTGATAVTFDGVPATFTVVSDTEITTTVPDGALTGPVGVTTPFGSDSSAVNFLVAPRISSFTPTSGPVGTLVTIKGSGLTQATVVEFNGVSAVFTVVNDGKITATVPAGATTGKIEVESPGGTGISRTDFTVT
jgi:FG-GAP repeat protein/IPT/TIG domain-containing protein